ncbi:MAG: hypothetical protein GQ570_09500 [Helicobacteraceae bacterium]|nr:hypothetical protein [Helicobacteraceae bacterium]
MFVPFTLKAYVFNQKATNIRVKAIVFTLKATYFALMFINIELKTTNIKTKTRNITMKAKVKIDITRVNEGLLAEFTTSVCDKMQRNDHFKTPTPAQLHRCS